MRYSIFDDMTQCTEAEVQALLPLVSQQRREQALQYRHVFGQFVCLKSYMLLMELLGTSDRPEFCYNEYGKPFLQDDWQTSAGTHSNSPLHFSISHCRNAIAVAVSEQPIGIDIETVRPFRSALVARTMNEQEQATILSAADPSRAFTVIWTQKEAVVKWQGTGIISDLRPLLVDTQGTVTLRTFAPDGKDYIYSLAQAGTINS